ncbi:RTA1-like protein [Coprinellus micaceus]|uniref:RTA1-like protein n=1 Tax=Coprinellus micaceus TaxID=71717 RepID=A0A4Y7T0T9_COPMI|nr:RTA1-like protein [Coprinellus micaceus]
MSLGTTPRNFYHYVPSKWAGFVFTGLFVAITLAHLGVAVRRRMWFILPTIVTCGILEIIGWACRLMSSYDPHKRMPYIIQTSTIVLAPTAFLAVVFILTGQIIGKMGSIYSRLNARYYTVVFLSCDIFALLVQGSGGGLAASASSGNGDPTLGANIMLGGIIFQTSVIFLFALSCLEFFIRYFRHRPVRTIGSHEKASKDTDRGEFTKELRIMVWALTFITFILFVRAIYRTIELAGGWEGPVIKIQSLFLIFDPLMIVLAMGTLNIIHPWKYLYSTPAESFRLVSTNTPSYEP